MAKTYKILVNDGKGTDIKPVSVLQGIGETGQPVRMVAKRGWRFELQDELKGRDLGPDQLRIKRMGKDLGLMFDGSKNSDVVIEDFYADNTEVDKDNGMPTLVGLAENGGIYEYVPQDPSASSMPSALKDGNTPVIVSLGGGPLTGDFVLAGLPLIAAAGGGFGGWLAGGALLAAAVAGGGKGGGGSSAVLPSGETGHLTHDALNDTGVSITDSYTKNNKPQLTINAEHGATVVVHVGNYDYDAKETSTPGIYTVSDVGSKEANGKLDDGVYTPIIKVTNSAGTSTANGEAFTIDTSSANNQDASKTPVKVADENNLLSIVIGSIDDGSNSTTTDTGSKDTGTSTSDFITSDKTLSFKGTVDGFKANGDIVHLQVIAADGVTVILDQYLTPDAKGNWIYNNQANALSLGQYTINASIEDLAGNAVLSAARVLTISTTNTLVALNDAASVLQGATITKDVVTGVLANDSDTSARSMKVSAVNGSSGNVGVVIDGVYGQLQLFSDGSYTYIEKDKSLAEGVHKTETFSYEVQAYDSNQNLLQRPTTKALLNIDITGVNDPATVILHIPKPLTTLLQASDTYASNGHIDPLLVNDVDIDPTTGLSQAGVQGISRTMPTTSTGVYFDLTVNKNSNNSYDWNYTHAGKAAAPDSSANKTVHDLFSFTSIDGTSNATLDLQIATDSATTQEFNVSPLGTSHSVQGITATGGQTIDTLILHGSIDPQQQTSYDFSDSKITHLTSIENIDLQGKGPISLKLNLADLTQGEVSTNGNPLKLYITGSSNATVDFHSLTSSNAAVNADANQLAVNNLLYNVYHIGNDELLVQTAITNISVYN